MSQKNIVLIALAAVLLIAFVAGCASSSPTAKAGDNVSIDYIISFSNGTIWGTTYKQVAIDTGIYNANNSYRPFNFTVGNPSTIEGISDAVAGMKVGELKNGTIPPEKAFGVYNQSLIKPFIISSITGDNNSTLNIGDPLFYSKDGVYVSRAYVYAVDRPNNTVYLDYNNKLADMAFLYQITLRTIE
jgi:FKBP-type peptidyl-prolyl cis-trans isomerase 2